MSPNANKPSANISVAINARETFSLKNHGALSLGAGVHLSCGRVHEVMGEAADIFAIAAARLTAGPVVWIGGASNIASLAPTGLAAFLDPTRLIATFCVSRHEVLWASEQALRTPGTGCVIAELEDGPDLTTSRRLQIAAEEGGALGIMMIEARAQTSAAQTRWICKASADREAPWIWRLVKNKSGKVGVWRAGWSPENGRKEDAPGIVLMAAATAA